MLKCNPHYYQFNPSRGDTIKQLLESYTRQDIKDTCQLSQLLYQFKSNNISSDEFIGIVTAITSRNPTMRALFEKNRGFGYHLNRMFSACINLCDGNIYLTNRFATIINQTIGYIIQQCALKIAYHAALQGHTQLLLNYIFDDDASAYSNLYEVFNRVLVDRRGIFGDPQHPIAQHMAEAIIRQVSYAHGLFSGYYQILKAVLVDRSGIFSDPQHPITQKMIAAIMRSHEIIDYSLDVFNQLFSDLFIVRRGIFGDLQHPITQKMIDRIIEFINNNNNLDNISVYRALISIHTVSIVDRGIFSYPQHPIIQRLIKCIKKFLDNHPLSYTDMKLLNNMLWPYAEYGGRPVA